MSEKTDTLEDMRAICDEFNKFVGVDWVVATPFKFDEAEIKVVFRLFPSLTRTTMGSLELLGLISGKYSREEVIAHVVLEAFRDWDDI